MLVKSRLRSDGTMPFGLKYFGAHTGRWSGSERINLQNPRKRPVLVNEHGLMETSLARLASAFKQHDELHTWPEWVRWSIDFRALIIPRPGKKMIACDLSQIEPRVLAWLCKNHKLLEAVKGGMSVYEAFARANLGFTGAMSKKSDYYKLVKIMVLGLGYQAGWEKFITICASDLGGNIDITKDDPEFFEETDPFTGEVERIPGYGKRSKEIVAEFRTKNKNTVDMWKQLDDGFKRSSGGTFTVTLPSGRKLNYRGVSQAIQMTVNKKTGKPERKVTFMAESDGRRKQYYGGKLTENVTQAASRDVFGEHLVSLMDNFGDESQLFSAHDEAVGEYDQSVQAKDVEHIMSQCPPWLEGCPIAAEAKEMTHYEK